ncbi:MAG: ADP/ATP-dependent (S)-NAD(P)H-hydrate dehydratase, partial [Patescibacteria group bacterium]
MKIVTIDDLKQLYIPPSTSHKGQNGRLLIIGGSHLFHSASLWALKVASRIVDLVHYSSVAENNELVMKLKEEFRDGIIVPRSEIENYIEEDDAILIGPGMTRDTETEELTNRLLKKYPHKQWVIDAGALQMMDIELIPKNAILTPHPGEFARIMGKVVDSRFDSLLIQADLADQVKLFAKRYSCVVLYKSEVDLGCSGGECDGRIC